MDNNPTLAKPARQALEAPTKIIVVSAVSAWEITVKKARGQLTAPDHLAEVRAKNRWLPLPSTLAHAVALASWPARHQDPVDRWLAAQVKGEGLT